VNQTNANGWHSLIFAVYGGHLDVIDFLLFDANVDCNLKGLDGKDAETIANDLEDLEMLALFEDKNCNHSSSYSSLIQSLEDE
jgi:hypothetical protein